MAKCRYPITIGKQDGLKRWKVVPCGKCVNCRRRRQSSWSFRLLHEMQSSTSAAFLTLTYDDLNVPLFDEVIEGKEFLIGKKILVKRDLQLFIKRLRKEQQKYTNDKIKYYACGEYGGLTNRPHYHIIIFNVLPSLLFDSVLSEIWKLGFVRVDECNIKTIQYTTKYVMKAPNIPNPDYQQEFSLMSKGLGKSFLTEATIRYYQEHEKPFIVRENGAKQTMPRYYKERIFDEQTLRRFGREALEEQPNKFLDSTTMHEIQLDILKLRLLQDEKRFKI